MFIFKKVSKEDRFVKELEKVSIKKQDLEKKLLDFLTKDKTVTLQCFDELHEMGKKTIESFVPKVDKKEARTVINKALSHYSKMAEKRAKNIYKDKPEPDSQELSVIVGEVNKIGLIYKAGYQYNYSKKIKELEPDIKKYEKSLDKLISVCGQGSTKKLIKTEKNEKIEKSDKPVKKDKINLKKQKLSLKEILSRSR